LPFLDLVASRSVKAGERLRVRSALNPILWLTALISIPSIYASTKFQPSPPLWLIVLAYLPVGAAIVGFLFLLIWDRDKLQSEDYQLRKHSLDLIQQKGDAFPVAPTSLQAIANPQRSPIEPRETGE
jgi:hypothetical protein